MATHPLAGKPAPRKSLINVPQLITRYYTHQPDPEVTEQRVTFGTSGHRGSSLATSFNEAHILATTEAIVRYRAGAKIDGPLFLGIDTHALSVPAAATALEVLAAHGVEVRIAADGCFTPTPVISHAILTHNRDRTGDDARGLADGIVITPSHNPPQDGGFKYDPPHGGPADTDATQWIEQTANDLLADARNRVKRIPYERARSCATTQVHDFMGPFVSDLGDALDLEAVREAGLRIGVDPMGGAGLAYWAPIADQFGLNVTVVNEIADPTFRFMTLDHDGKIRMDCSSPHAMAGLIGLKDDFDVAFGNDPDYDRHGIVTRSSGLLNPNHYLATAIAYLFSHRPGWSADAAVGKTLVSSSMIDRVAAKLGRRLAEVPVGFKWFVEGLRNGSYGFAGEESAGATFLRRNGQVWTTDKDGILLDLLAAEMTATTGRDPGELYADLTHEHGEPVYQRIDAPATAAQKAALKKLRPEAVARSELAGEKIVAVLTDAPENGAPIGGLKVVTENGWFAARPSGTEEIYKIYTESFRGRDHLEQIQRDAQEIVNAAFSAGAARA